ncbi:MAG: cation diffusion facilitator family transporter, partial [Pirellulales bacterium]|nr:cation diffusion facilitator family transporter [Pirellulales bacterium]
GFVTLIKFLAWALSNSDAMLSEAIHSAADTGNQLLLFWGLSKSSRQSDEDHQYGYVKDRFIFGMLSASGIFFVGSGVTLYHGIHGLLHPRAPEIGPLVFVVLGLSALIEGSVLAYAIASVRRQSEGLGMVRYLRERADPATLAILLEDSAAVFGLGLATIGIVASHQTENPAFDAGASILIGLLLGVIAWHLIAENRDFLLGKAIPDADEEAFKAILRGRALLRSFLDVKTRQLGPDLYHLKAEVVFDPEAVARAVDPQLVERVARATPEGRAEALVQLSRAHLDLVAAGKEMLLDPPPVDEGAVGTVQVGNFVTALGSAELGMLPRDFRIVDLDRVRRITAHTKRRTVQFKARALIVAADYE